MTAMTKLPNFKSLDASIVYAKATKISFAEQGKKSSPFWLFKDAIYKARISKRKFLITWRVCDV